MELSDSDIAKQTLSLLAPQQTAFGKRTDPVTEWIDGATVQTENVDGKPSQVSTGFAWSLYHHTLELFSFLYPLTLAWSIPSYNRQLEKSFKKSLGRLFLWGDGFRDGKLESVLDESEGLRDIVIESLAAIGKILVFELAPKCLENCTSSQHKRIRQEIQDLKVLVEKARILTENEYESDESSTLSSTESGQSVSPGIANAVKVYVECLMELLPSMEETMGSLEYDDFEDQRSPPIDFQVSDPAQPYVLKVYDKFPKAELRLIHRLGEANWQRHMSLRMMNNQMEDNEIPQEVPKALFVAISLFHDSGLGSSLPARSSYAATAASHSSFQSTAADKDGGLRVPPTPKEVFEGVPFSCQICGHMLSRIKNRIDWRRHVFADLKPYICTFSSCKDEMKTFPTRKLWEEHEFSQHRLKKYWSCSSCPHQAGTPEDWREHLERTHGLHLSNDQYLIAAPSAEKREPMPIDLESCPLCLEVPGKSQRKFATHVGKHMEAIALAALPRAEESTDSESTTFSDSSNLLSKKKMEVPQSVPVRKLKLSYSKCRCCRKDRRACKPVDREWPEKCDRCKKYDYDCSPIMTREGEVEHQTILTKSDALAEAPHQQPKLGAPTLPFVDDFNDLNDDDPSNSILRTGATDIPILGDAPLNTEKETAELNTLPRLSARASNRISEHILKPLIAKSSLKDFHPIVKDCPRKIHSKEIVCLRDLEKTLIFMAPERVKSAALYLDFSLTSMRCIQATVEFLSEREQTRPHDRPYTNGYFVDLAHQVKRYARGLQEAKEREETLDEMDPDSTDEIEIHGGLMKNDRPAELVRVKKNGKAISIATGLPVDLSDNATPGTIPTPSRSLSEEAKEDEEILRAMARRKRSATASELAPKRCREPGCEKQFKRPCDLTKHEKTHSRPWKCPIESCKYHEYGWPTEKEMDRHHNEKHGAAPAPFECLFKPCPYRSKRESNCKQHMEKAHGWEYTRSSREGKKNVTADGLPNPLQLQDDFQASNTNGDFSMFKNEDLYSARAQTPTRRNEIFQTNFGGAIPDISHGNTMLYTPKALQEVDEGFEDFIPDNSNTGGDFNLFPSTSENVAKSAPFGETPAYLGSFPNVNASAQELLDFYNRSR